MTIHINKTLRTMLLATVAGSFLLVACSSNPAEQQQPKVSGALRAPQNNPNAAVGDARANAQMDGMRAPLHNPEAAVGAEYSYKAPSQAIAQQSEPMMAREEKSGLFSWMTKKPEPEVDTTQRRVPKLNQQADTSMQPTAMASYEAAAPVSDVHMAMPFDDGGEWAALEMDDMVAMPFQTGGTGEQFAPLAIGEPTMEQPKGYPGLASVPPRPERLDSIAEKDTRIADLKAARDASVTQHQQMDRQMALDMGEQGALESDINTEFAALVASPHAQESTIPLVQEDAPAIVVGQGQTQPWQESQQWQEPVQPMQQAAPVEMVSATPPSAMQNWEPQNWEPVPMVEPQVAYTTTHQYPAQQDEWVSMQQDPAAQMAVPVEGVAVAGMPQVAAVSAVPVMPEGDGIRLVPPSMHGAAVRTLPESRYAARRQAVYMQRYARQPGTN